MMTGQKLVRFLGLSRHSSTRMHKNTSASTVGAVTFLKMSTSFSWIVGSEVKNSFFSPQSSKYDILRIETERNMFSYSRFVKMFVEETVVILPATSAKADLSALSQA